MKFSWILNLVFLIQLCPSSSNAGDLRQLTNDSEFQFVGTLKFGTSLRDRCTVSIMRHGLIVTAKHCFNHQRVDGVQTLIGRDKSAYAPEDLSALFPKFPDRYEEAVLLHRGQIQEIILDQGENDIAFLTYNPSLTENKIKLPEIKLSASIPEAGTEVFSVGFPGLTEGDAVDTVKASIERLKEIRQVLISDKSSDPATLTRVIQMHDFLDSNFNELKNSLDLADTSKRLISQCKVTGRVEEFKPRPKHPGYEGVLVETTCPGWYGASGSLLMSGFKTPDGETGYRIYGVLTHTLEISPDAENDRIIPEAIHRDQFGVYARKVAFSPFALSAHLH